MNLKPLLLLTLFASPSAVCSYPRHEKDDYDFKLKELLDLSRITSVTAVPDTLVSSVFTKTVRYLNSLYWLSILPNSANSPAVVALGFVEGATGKWQTLQTTSLSSATSLTAFVHPAVNDRLYFVVANPASNEETKLMFYDRRGIQIEHKFPERQLQYVTSWKSAVDNQIHLAMAPKNGSVVVYSWQDSSFMSRSSSIDGCQNAVHLESFTNGGIDFMACTSSSGTVELFRYELSQLRWHSHQVIPSSPTTVATHFFRNAKSAYLVVLNRFNQQAARVGLPVVQASSIVYKQSGVSESFVFSAFQNLDVRGAVSASSFHRTQNWGVFVLAVASQDEGVVLFEFDGWRLERSKRLGGPAIDSLRRTGSLNVHMFTDEKANIFLALSNPHYFGPGVFNLSVDSFSEEKRWYGESFRWCQEKLDSNAAENAGEIQQQLSKFVLIDSKPQGPIVIHGEVETPGGLEVERLRADEINDVVKGHRYVAQSLRELPHLEENIRNTRVELNTINIDLQQTVKTVGSNIITVPLQFDELHVDSSPVHSLRTQWLNGRRVVSLPDKILRKDVVRELHGSWQADHIEAKTVNTDHINGIRPQHFVTKNTDQIISGNLHLMNKTHASSVSSEGLINGVNFSPRSILMRNGNQTLSGVLTLNSPSVGNLRVESGIVGGINLSKLMVSTPQKHQSNVLFGNNVKAFKHMEIRGTLKMTDESLLNGVPMRKVFNYVDIYLTQQVFAPMVFLNASFQQMSTLHVNGLAIPGPDLVYTNRPNGPLSASKRFEQPISTSGLYFSRSFNGQRLLKGGQLDVLLKSPAQEIPAPITFDSISLGSASELTGSINGLTFGEILAHKLQRHNEDELVVFGDAVFTKPLLANQVNGINLHNLLRRGISLNSRELPASEVKFAGPVKVSELRADFVNLARVPSDFLPKRLTKHTILPGSLDFEDLILHGTNVTIAKDFSGVDLNLLGSDTLYTNANHVQRILGPKKLIATSFAASLKAKTINRMSLLDLCHLDLGGCQLQGPKTLRKIVANVAHFSQLEAGQIGNVDVNDLLENSLLFSKPQIFRGSCRLKSAALTGGKFETSKISGVDIVDLLRHGIRLDVPVEIHSPVSFNQKVVVRTLDYFHSINGVSQEDFLGWMVNGTAQTMRPQTKLDVLARLEARKGLEITASWNDFNFNQLVGSSINLRQPIVFNERMIFNTTRVDRLLETKRIQGLDPLDLVVIGDRRIITGRKHFERGLAAGALQVEGPIGSVDLTKLNNSVLWKSRQGQIMTSQFDLHASGPVEIRERLQIPAGARVLDIDLAQAWSKCRNKSFIGNLLERVDRLVVKGPLETESLNGIHSWRLKDYVSKSSPGSLPTLTPDSEVTVTAGAQLDSLVCEQVNARDIRKHVESSLSSNRPQDVTTELHFDEVVLNGPLSLKGKLNGISIPNDVFSTRENVIHLAELEAKNLRIVNVHNDDLHISGAPVHRILGSNSTKFSANGVYEIDGSRLRNSEISLRVKQLAVIGRINQQLVDLEHSLVKSIPQTIRGEVTLRGMSVIKKLSARDIRLDIQGIRAASFSDLMSNALFKGKENVVHGAITFETPIEARSVRSLVASDAPVLAFARNISLQATQLSRSMETSIATLKRVEQNVKLRDQALPYYYDEILSGPQSEPLVWAHQASYDGDWFFAVVGDPAARCGRLGVVGPQHRGPLNLSLTVGRGIESMSTAEFNGQIYLITISPNSPSSNCLSSASLGSEPGEVAVLRLDRTSRTLKQEMLLRASVDSVASVVLNNRLCLALSGELGLRWTCVDGSGSWHKLTSPLGLENSSTGALDIQNCAGLTLAAIAEDQKLSLYTLEPWRSLMRFPIEIAEIAIIPLNEKCLVLAAQKRSTLPLVLFRVDREKRVEQVQRLLIGDSIKKLDVIRVSGRQALLMLSASPRLHVIQLDIQRDRLNIVGELNFETDEDLRTFGAARRGHYITTGGTILYSE